MLITVLIVIAVLLTLILFTIAAANPNAFWNGVAWILFLGAIAGIVVGGYYGVRWLLTLDWSGTTRAAGAIGTVIQTTWIGILLFVVVPLFFYGATKAVIENYKQVFLFLIFIVSWSVASAASFLSVRWLVAQTGIDQTFHNFSAVMGVFAILPASLTIIWLSQRLSAWLEVRTETFRQDPEGE